MQEGGLFCETPLPYTLNTRARSPIAQSLIKEHPILFYYLTPHDPL